MVKLLFLGIQISYLWKGKRCGTHRWDIPKAAHNTKLGPWETHDARIISWTLSSVDPHISFNLRPDKNC